MAFEITPKKQWLLSSACFLYHKKEAFSLLEVVVYIINPVCGITKKTFFFLNK